MLARAAGTRFVKHHGQVQRVDEQRGSGARNKKKTCIDGGGAPDREEKEQQRLIQRLPRQVEHDKKVYWRVPITGSSDYDLRQSPLRRYKGRFPGRIGRALQGDKRCGTERNNHVPRNSKKLFVSNSYLLILLQ